MSKKIKRFDIEKEAIRFCTNYYKAYGGDSDMIAEAIRNIARAAKADAEAQLAEALVEIERLRESNKRLLRIAQESEDDREDYLNEWSKESSILRADLEWSEQIRNAQHELYLGGGCLQEQEDGNGPCGACLPCVRADLEAALADVALCCSVLRMTTMHEGNARHLNAEQRERLWSLMDRTLPEARNGGDR